MITNYWKGDSWRAWYLCSRCEGLSYERGIRFALWVSWNTQLWCATREHDREGDLHDFSSYMKTWVQRQGKCNLFGNIADWLADSSSSAGGEGKEWGDWVGQRLGKWIWLRRSSSCWADSTSAAASGTCDGPGSIKAGITVHGGLTRQAGAAAENDMVEKTQSQVTMMCWRVCWLTMRLFQTFGATENRTPGLGKARKLLGDLAFWASNWGHSPGSLNKSRRTIFSLRPCLL